MIPIVDRDANPERWQETENQLIQLLVSKELNSGGDATRKWNPVTRIQDAMALLAEIGSIEYMKWRISSSYYHGTAVVITVPAEGYSGFRSGMRKAHAECFGDSELPETITRAVLYALGEDVEIYDPMHISVNHASWNPDLRRAAEAASDAANDHRLLGWLRQRHPEWLREEVCNTD